MPSALVPNLNMVRRNIPREMKLLALRLYQDGLSHVEITRTTGISKRATSRLVLAYRETGDVERPAPPHLRGRRLALNQDEVIFVLQCWEGNPDISLKELVSIVKDKYGKEVSITTISRYINSERRPRIILQSKFDRGRRAMNLQLVERE
ncbi:hypothetical protein BXZ70DRAFT_905215 [Cristinia sonorae]|uniref:Uncharacterized protein n=1 Tax=Cristinia sonorae TaxID=1940300 RepID=A0A8K0UTQ5_9AGAR|nr:hypothetical protein BXZ70DRAFT_905215 [Cristinia sonorae]